MGCLLDVVTWCRLSCGLKRATTFLCFSVNRRQGGSAGDHRNQRSGGVNASSSAGSGTRTSSSSLRPSSSKSSSSSRTREEKKEKLKPEEKPAAEEEEEEVSGVMEGGGVGEDVGEERVTDGDAEGEEPEGAESVEGSEDVPREEVRKQTNMNFTAALIGRETMTSRLFRRVNV